MNRHTKKMALGEAWKITKLVLDTYVTPLLFS